MTNRIRIADLIGKDVSGVRGDVRGGRYEEMEPLVRTLTKVERRPVKKYGVKSRWIYVHWTPEPRSDGGIDCGYSGWEESYFNELDPAIIVR